MFFISCRAYLKMSSDSQIHCNETWRRAALLWLEGLIFCFYMNSWRRRVPNCWPSALASQGSGLKSTWRGETDFYTFNSSIDVFHQSPVIYFSFQLKLVKCAEDLYFWEHLIKLRSRFPSLASFPFIADPPSEDARWDSSNEGDEERGFKAVLTDTMSRRWATVSSWMFLVGSHCVVVVVVV